MDETKMAGLAGLVDEIDAERPPTPEEMAARQAEEAAKTEKAKANEDAELQARQWGAIPYMVGRVLCMAAPDLRQVYTESACLDWGRAMVPVAAKYGWQDAGKLPELGLVLATAAFAIPSFFAIRQAVAEQKSGWLGQVGTWWRNRKARRAGQAEADKG